MRGAAIDYLEIDRGYSLVKVAAPARFLGIPLGETKLRQQHGVTIAAFRDSAGVWQNADNATVLASGRRRAHRRSDRARRRRSRSCADRRTGGGR